MKEMATVLEVKNKDALVRVQRKEACGTCRACSMWREKSEYMDFTIQNTLDVQVGDSVEVDLGTSDVLTASFVMYVIPLVVMISGVVLGYYVFTDKNEMVSAVCGLVFLVISYMGIKLSEKRLKNSDRFKIKMTKKVTPII